jgi:hypothetical protein
MSKKSISFIDINSFNFLETGLIETFSFNISNGTSFSGYIERLDDNFCKITGEIQLDINLVSSIVDLFSKDNYQECKFYENPDTGYYFNVTHSKVMLAQ